MSSSGPSPEALRRGWRRLLDFYRASLERKQRANAERASECGAESTDGASESAKERAA